MVILDPDRNLLFGVLALQMDFISREALVAAVTAWTSDRSKPLDRILVGQGALTESRRTLLEALVSEHLKAHDEDPQQSLASIQVLKTLRGALDEVDDPELRATLEHSTESTDSGPALTIDLGSRTSDGLRFQILRPHARGGIGLVSVALDTELNREVALKEIHIEQADDTASRARFVLEAEVTGRLEHPGVVPVYGLGSNSAGRPYYAMRLIKGDSLKEAIARFHVEGEQPLALRGLLNRFIDVCNAVAYAHSRGILHRDLKPANVMLGPYGETLVVDWGLAKVIGRPEIDRASLPEVTLHPVGLGSGSSETMPGSTVGTPAYMSPEQAEGRLDALGPASDVYSLGATLYCLLTGRPPFEGTDVVAILRQVQKGEYPAPRSINWRIPRALESVCQKAMSLRPDDRYSSARSLAEDLEHWLADEPVTPYREPVPMRMARWGRRHRPLVAGATALLLTMLVALVAGVILLGQAGARTEQQRLRAEENFAEAQRQRDLARTSSRLARRAVDKYFVQVSESTLLKSPGLQLLRRELLESALTYYLEFVKQRGDDPELQAELAQAYFHVGSITGEVGSPEDALGHFLKAQSLYRTLSQANPNNIAYSGELAKAYRYAGRMEAGMAKSQAAIASFREAIAIGESTIGGPTEVPEYRRDLAWGYNNLGVLLFRGGHAAEGRVALRTSIVTWEPLVASNPRPEFRHGLAEANINLGYYDYIAGRMSQGIALTSRAVSLDEAAIAENGTEPKFKDSLAHALDNLGMLYNFNNEPDKARNAYERALTVAEPLAAENPAVTDFQERVIEILIDLGHLCLQAGDHPAARSSLAKADQRTKKLSDSRPKYFSYAALQRGLGKVLFKEGDKIAAFKVWQDAVRIGESDAGERPYSLYELACARALCSSVVGTGNLGPTDEDRPTKQRYRDEAMAALEEAVAGGWENLAWMRVDSDLDELRSLDRFKELIAKLERAEVSPE
jgi:eukaryotic-like serine/threonine-protein kinase